MFDCSRSYLYPIIFGFVLLLVGIFLVEQYELSYRFKGLDKLLHFSGGFVAAWFVATLFTRELRLPRPWVAGLIMVSAVALIGVVWEFAEFSTSLIRSDYPQLYHFFHGGNLEDTLGDLLADMAGGASFALIFLPTLTKKMGVLSSNDQSK